VSAIRNFKQLSRQNTGRHFLDSGDHYGRHFDRPLPKQLVSIGGDMWTDHAGNTRHELSATIHLGEFLDRVCEIDRDLRRRFKAFARRPANQDLAWWDAEAAFMESLGYEEVCGDNACNWENDLDQVFALHVYMPAGRSSADWLYSDDAVVWIATHNGCDLLDVVAGWSFLEGTDSDGNELDRDALQALDEEFQVGYTANPTYRLNEQIASILELNKAEGWARIQLKSGETIKAYANCRAEYL
jgi:hypothetical protein